MADSKEFDRPKETMPARTEAGFFFSAVELEKVRQTLESLGYSRLDYENPYTQSIYFAENSGRTPTGGYVRLRSYAPSPSQESFKVALGSNWYLEGKISGGPKERVLVPMETALDILTDPTKRGAIKDVTPAIYQLLAESGPMLPVVATQWHREHYILDDSNRATIDLGLTYFAFVPGSMEGLLIGVDSSCRIEWKSQTDHIPSSQFQDIDLIAIPQKWHEATIRKMYIEWLSYLKVKHD